jgi:hypothetical protein
LLGVEAAELGLYIETGLTTEIYQFLGIDIKLARQRIDADLFVQSELLYSISLAPEARPAVGQLAFDYSNWLVNPGKENPSPG